MKENIDYIIEVLEDSGILIESNTLEFKSAKGGIPRSLWESYSSFANSEGGVIILGISEKNYKFYLDGFTESEVFKYKDDFWNQINNREKVSINLLCDKDVFIRQIRDDIYILIIRIRAASYRYRPVYVGSDMLKGTYKRNNSGDYKCTVEEVRRMIADALPEKPDGKLLKNTSMDDLDLNSLNQYRNILYSAKPTHPFLACNDKELLIKLGAWKTDRDTGLSGLTAAGLLMFGKSLSIIEYFPDYHVDYQEILSEDMRWEDRIFPDGTWEANLFQFFHRVWPKLSATLPKPFQLENGQRKDDSKIHEALREAFANSIIHADYNTPGGIVIKKHIDKFTFENPGYFLITLEQYYRGGCSVPRNTTLQTMFSLLGYGEKAGSGSLRIMEAWKGAHWQKPFVSICTRPDRITLSMSMNQLLPKQNIDHLVKIFGSEIKNLYGDSLTILSIAEIEGYVNNSRLQRVLDKHPNEISLLLKELCLQGYLIPGNKGRWTTYRLNQVTSSPTLFEDENLATSKEKPCDLEIGTLQPGDWNLATSEEKPCNLVIETLQPKKRKRISREEMKKLILDLCSEEYQTIEGLARLIDRNADYIKNEFIPLLMKEGLLERRYPMIPNHPEQAYKKK